MPRIGHLQVLLQSHFIIASECLSKLSQSQPPWLYPNSLDYGLQFYTMMARRCTYKSAQSQPWTASPSWQSYSLQVYLETCLIPASKFTPGWAPKFITKVTQSRSPSASMSPVGRFTGWMFNVYCWLDWQFTEPRGSIVSLVWFFGFPPGAAVLAWLSPAWCLLCSLLSLCFRGWCRFL